MVIGPSAKTTSHSGHLNIYFFQWYAQAIGHSLFSKFRSLQRTCQMNHIIGNTGEKIHRFHGIVRQKRCSIGTLNYLRSFFECRLRITISPFYSAGPGSHLLHESVMICTVFETRRNGNLLGSSKPSGGNLCSRTLFPLHSHCLFGLHYFPCGISNHYHCFSKSIGAKVPSGLIVGKRSNGKYLFNSAHLFGSGGIKRFQSHTKGWRVYNHGYEHAFLFVVYPKHGLTGHNIFSSYIFSSCTHQCKLRWFFEFERFGYFYTHRQRSHFAIACRVSTGHMRKHSFFGCNIACRNAPLFCSSLF